MSFKPGDKVIWKRPGGFGTDGIPGVVKKITSNKVTIEITHGSGIAMTRSVKPQNLIRENRDDG